MKNTYVYAKNCENGNGFNVYLDLSGQTEFVYWHRNNFFLYNILKDGIQLEELRKRRRSIRIKNRYQSRKYSAKRERMLEHLIAVLDEYIEYYDEPEYAA